MSAEERNGGRGREGRQRGHADRLGNEGRRGRALRWGQLSGRAGRRAGEVGRRMGGPASQRTRSRPAAGIHSEARVGCPNAALSWKQNTMGDERGGAN